MVVQGPYEEERRRDRRVRLAGTVRLEPTAPSGVLQAEVVDVSARGLRARLPKSGSLAVGERVEIELSLPPTDERSDDAGEVLFRGRGTVLRLQSGELAAQLDAALSFAQPLEFRRRFEDLALF